MNVLPMKQLNGSYGGAIMDDHLKPVRTVKKVQNSIEKFESLNLRENPPPSKDNQPLKIVSSAKPKRVLEFDRPSDQALNESALEPTPSLPIARSNRRNSTGVRQHKQHDSTAFLQQSYLNKTASPALSDNAREILRCQPSHEDLVAVLQYLQFGVEGQHDFNILVASPRTAQIINVLVSVTIPDVWANIGVDELSTDEAKMKRIIISCLSSVAGLGALLAQIKQLTAAHSFESVLSDTIAVLGHILKGHKTLLYFLHYFRKLYDKESDKRILWHEMTGLVAGSRVLSTVAQAFTTVPGLKESSHQYLWMGDGIQYTKWLGGNVAHAAINLNVNDKESWIFLSQVTKRGLSLGHRDIFVAEIYTKLLLGKHALWTPLHSILNYLTNREQTAFFDSILSNIAQNFVASDGGLESVYLNDDKAKETVAGAAALVAGIIKSNEVLSDHVEKWLVGETGSSMTISFPVRRALFAALGQSEGRLRRILEKSLSNFGDGLQIQHASMVQQEAMAQSILLAISYLSRIDIDILKRPSISTLVMHTVSNRLNASVPQTRLLGMIVGTAVSQLTDKQNNVIDFGFDEAERETANRWIRLTSLTDRVGKIQDLGSSSLTPTQSSSIQPNKPSRKPARKAVPTHTSKVIAIEEISGSSEEDDDDLMPYQKPDSDPDDSEEDATLINRSKPSAPVYIVDLIKQLQVVDKPDIISLALKTAPSLVRRKAAFGTEVSDNIQTLVTTLVNLQEGMSDEHLQKLRLESLIACIVARPGLVGPSLADVYFRGDFSLSQRTALLVGIGLAVRELAGFKDEQDVSADDTFPTKRLPAHLEPRSRQAIAATHNAVAMLTDIAAQTMIRPMALAAADQATGPSALKIRTFSSRMEVEKKNQAKTAARTNTIPKNLHKVLTEAIYLPLCSRMSLLLSHTMGGRLPNTTILHTSTLRLFLQTLTLVLHTLGPSASLHLPTLTHESLLLLLNLHTLPYISTDPAILPALLHLLLALLDITIEAGITAQERLVTEHGPKVAELVNWSNSLGDKISVPDAEAGEGGIAWSVLAAGIQVKWFEMGRRFQGRMLGLSMDEMDQLSRS